MLENFITLVLILTPLVVGFLLPLPQRFMPLVDKLLTNLVFVILTFIGLSLSQIANLGAQIGFIGTNVAVLAICTLGAGFISLLMFDRLHPWQRALPHAHSQAGFSITGSLVQLCCVVLGFVLGKLLPIFLPITDLPIDGIIKGLLILLILLVGFQLSHSGMTLRQVLVNKRGVQACVIFCLSVAVGGLVYALIMPDVTFTQGLALSSGYGWYSLSGIIMTDAYGAVWGSVALLNDLLREFTALLFIPMLIRKYPTTAVGLGGVTTMDFTLPVIQSSGGNEVVPLAMSFGFLVNIISPVLMVVFSSFG
ncbi:MAG: lysine exporter LysO family protein [Gammaproteobacteria bacterium]|nr:lysine exporter LysO family protein [Gammaproteobacteria bacterium]NPA78713.1 lysine exporter LysO family protein [Gammaproteobacteria bacterium]